MNAAQKMYEARKCPQCGSNLMPPYISTKENNCCTGDKVCDHCKLDIVWEKHWVAMPKEEV